MESYYSLPAHLRKYCVEQDYGSYTSRDQAAWRYIMRQNRDFFSSHAVPIYEEGLKKTGIAVDRIPRISEMDTALKKFGWGAVAVSSFIPPAAFLEFQARGVLAIACGMRTLEHVEYTPAPDIVHEAAGHAPIIADPEYAAYLKRYAKMAQKAIFSKEDVEVYEAIRYLSDIKENPDTQPDEAIRAEKRFQETSRSVGHVSEAAEVSRMAWWTVEYGLFGSLEKPLIYGAGLLSSVGESQNCLSSAVKKVPLDLGCVTVGYNITEPQPQLFVAKNVQHLVDVLGEYEKTMAFCSGGKKGLDKALLSELVNTVELNSGLQLSGKLESYEFDGEKVEFIKLTGPVQLSFKEEQLLGHGKSRHPHGFSSPIGLWEGFEKLPQEASDGDLERMGVQRGRRTRLVFKNGFVVEGVVWGWYHRNSKLVYITWRNCVVRRRDKVYFEPSWGEFDMAVGSEVLSVFGGPASFEDYGEYNVGEASTKPGRTSPYTDRECSLFGLYQDLRQFRKEEGNEQLGKKLEERGTLVCKEYPQEWLVALEIIELAKQKLGLGVEVPWLKSLSETVFSCGGKVMGNHKKLFENGLRIMETRD